MTKELSELSLEELWMLFPVFLVEQKREWRKWYVEEKAELENIIPIQAIHSIEHIGSTAINGIKAKNIVDILVELRFGTMIMQVAELLKNNGYLIMSANEERISLNKGYTKNGFADRVFHIHLRFQGDKDEVFFRDYLNEHPSAAKEYEALKISLSKEYEHDRDAYTDAKSEFILKWTEKAKQENS